MTNAPKTPLQVLKSAHERRQTGDRRRMTYDYPSNLVAQVLSTFEADAAPKPTRNAAVEAYANGQKIGIRRAPSGIAHARSV